MENEIGVRKLIDLNKKISRVENLKDLIELFDSYVNIFNSEYKFSNDELNRYNTFKSLFKLRIINYIRSNIGFYNFGNFQSDKDFRSRCLEILNIELETIVRMNEEVTNLVLK